MLGFNSLKAVVGQGKSNNTGSVTSKWNVVQMTREAGKKLKPTKIIGLMQTDKKKY